MNRILKAYRSATPDQYKQGMNWYNEANRFAASLDPDIVKAAGVIAALSPKVRWETNKKAAKLMLSAARTNGRMPVVAGWGHNRRRAWRIALGEDPVAVLEESKPQFLKVRRFFDNILGVEDLVTVDTWTAKVAMKNPPKSIIGKLYLDIESRFQKAAKTVGLAPKHVCVNESNL